MDSKIGEEFTVHFSNTVHNKQRTFKRRKQRKKKKIETESNKTGEAMKP
jgi:hypothetical protein